MDGVRLTIDGALHEQAYSRRERKFSNVSIIFLRGGRQPSEDRAKPSKHLHRAQAFGDRCEGHEVRYDKARDEYIFGASASGQHLIGCDTRSVQVVFQPLFFGF